MEIIRIPEERIAVLLGESGETKKDIEKKAQVKINISNEGEITLEGIEDKVYFAKEIVRAIGRGFSPQTALQLLDDNKTLSIINLKELLHTVNAITRIKARVIGEKGKVKKEIESATECSVSVYGHTIGIIGEYDYVNYAEEAVRKIIEGSRHTTVFNYLAEIKRKIASEKFIGQR